MVLDILLDAVLDTLKLLPFLFLTYLAMEFLEHRTSDKVQRAVKSAGKWGPVLGGLLGAVPQCGFSAAASGFYAGKIVTMGTLIAIYLSTSDEMLPILISEQVSPAFIGIILASKVVYGCIAGFVIDGIFKKETVKIHSQFQPDEPVFHDLCVEEKCNCEESVLKSSIKHTLQIAAFILVVNLVFNTVFEFIPEGALEGTIMNNRFVAPFIAGIIGLIPNCAASVLLTQMMLKGVLHVGGMMAGLMTSAGIGWMVLLRAGHNRKDTLRVISILYIAGVIGGFLFGLFF